MTAAPEGIDIRRAVIRASEDGYVLDADLDIGLAPPLLETLNRGVTLNFVLEFELQRPRWYWFNEKVATFTRDYRIAYNALTRQYRLSYGTLYHNFDTAAEVLGLMSRARDVLVLERNALAKDVVYAASLRMRLDTSQLPKPFQLSAIGSREWNIATDWFRWSVTP